MLSEVESVRAVKGRVSFCRESDSSRGLSAFPVVLDLPADNNFWGLSRNGVCEKRCAVVALRYCCCSDCSLH